MELCDEIYPNELKEGASQFLIGTKRQMEEQISNAEKIFVVRKNAIKMIIKRYSGGVAVLRRRGYVLKKTDDMTDYEAFVKKVGVCGVNEP